MTQHLASASSRSRCLPYPENQLGLIICVGVDWPLAPQNDIFGSYRLMKGGVGTVGSIQLDTLKGSDRIAANVQPKI